MGDQYADLARQLVTAWLIFQDEKPRGLESNSDVQVWSHASNPYGELIDEILDRADAGEEYLATNVIGQLVNLLHATIEFHLVLHNRIAEKQGGRTMTALHWWQETSQNLELGDT